MNRNSGIYLLTNRVNGKFYVGKAVNLRKRLQSHKTSNPKANYPISQAIKKYGWENFEISILESFEKINNEDLLLRESFWIKKLDAINKGYNILEYSSDWTGHSHSNESKLKMSKNHANFSGKNHPMFGKKHSEESKKAMSEKKKVAYIGSGNPFFGKYHTQETKNKIKAKNQKRDFSYRKRAVKQIDLDSGMERVWASAKEAAMSFGALIGSNITNACKKKIPSAFGYRWEYV